MEATPAKPLETAPSAVPDGVGPPASADRISFWRHPIAWFWKTQDSTSKAAPVMRTLWALVLLVGGFVVNEAYGYIRGKFVGPDQYLKELSDKQDRSFQELKDGVGWLSSVVDGQDREVLRQVEAASRDIRNVNAGLLQQLALARGENKRLSQVAGQQAGVRGGYDFMLTENTGLVIEPGVVLGLQDLYTSYAIVNLTGASETDGRKRLSSGESIAYRNAAGASCRITLLSISGDNGAASFSNSCA